MGHHLKYLSPRKDIRLSTDQFLVWRMNLRQIRNLWTLLNELENIPKDTLQSQDKKKKWCPPPTEFWVQHQSQWGNGLKNQCDRLNIPQKNRGTSPIELELIYSFRIAPRTRSMRHKFWHLLHHPARVCCIPVWMNAWRLKVWHSNNRTWQFRLLLETEQKFLYSQV